MLPCDHGGKSCAFLGLGFPDGTMGHSPRRGGGGGKGVEWSRVSVWTVFDPNLSLVSRLSLLLRGMRKLPWRAAGTRRGYVPPPPRARGRLSLRFPPWAVGPTLL